MSIKQKLLDDMKQAMRSHDSVKLDVVRFLRAAIKNWEIDNGEADDDAVIKIANSQAKQIRESIQEYKKGSRDDLVKQEQAKLAILETYLPKQLSDQDLEKIIKNIIDQAGPDAKIGPITGQVMGKVRGQADGKRVAAMVAQILK